MLKRNHTVLKKLTSAITILAVVFLLSSMFYVAKAQLPPPTNGGSCGTTDVEMIKKIQAKLGVEPNGICGPQTIAAVQIFQSTHSLTPDGIVGDKTLQALGLSTGTKSSDCELVGLTGAACCADDPVCKNGAGTSTPPGNGIKFTCPPNNPLCVPDGPYGDKGFAGSSTIMDLITKVINALLFFAGIIAVVAIVIGGYQYIAARGNEEMVESGQKTLTNAVIGLIIVIMAYAIVNLLVKSLIGDPTKTTGYLQKQEKIV